MPYPRTQYTVRMKVMFLMRPGKHFFPLDFFDKRCLHASFHARFIKLSHRVMHILVEDTNDDSKGAFFCNLQAVID